MKKHKVMGMILCLLPLPIFRILSKRKIPHPNRPVNIYFDVLLIVLVEAALRRCKKCFPAYTGQEAFLLYSSFC